MEAHQSPKIPGPSRDVSEKQKTGEMIPHRRSPPSQPGYHKKSSPPSAICKLLSVGCPVSSAICRLPSSSCNLPYSSTQYSNTSYFTPRLSHALTSHRLCSDTTSGLPSHFRRSPLAQKVPPKYQAICRIASHHSIPLIDPGFFEVQLMSSRECTRAGAISPICVVDIPSNART